MKYSSLLLAFVLLFAAACSKPNQEQAKSTDKIIPYPIEQKQLDNGLNVVTVDYPSPGLASFYIIVRVGSREEVEAGKTGFAHFFEHMMFRGTDKYSKEEYGKILKSIGAAANANTWLDRTVYHMTGNAEMLDKMFEIEADRFQHLKYSQHDFKTEAGAVKGEYTKSFSSPYSKLNEMVAGTAFEDHTYSHTTIGFWEDVVDMPNQFDYSLEFFKRFYKPEYTTILVVGDVKSDQVNQLAEKYFGEWERGTYQAAIPTQKEQLETRYTHLKQENFPPYLSLNFKSPAYDAQSKDNAALDLISTMLFSERSDLYKKLVVEEQKLRYLDGGFFYTRDPYLFTIDASVKNAEDMQYVKDQVMAKLEEIKAQPVSKELLEETKSRLKYSFMMSMDSPSAIAEALSYAIWVSGDPESFNNLYKTLESVRPEDIQKIAQKYFVSDKLTVATISPNEKGGVE
jgi:zinc protease